MKYENWMAKRYSRPSNFFVHQNESWRNPNWYQTLQLVSYNELACQNWRNKLTSFFGIFCKAYWVSRNFLRVRGSGPQDLPWLGSSHCICGYTHRWCLCSSQMPFTEKQLFLLDKRKEDFLLLCEFPIPNSKGFYQVLPKENSTEKNKQTGLRFFGKQNLTQFFWYRCFKCSRNNTEFFLRRLLARNLFTLRSFSHIHKDTCFLHVDVLEWICNVSPLRGWGRNWSS